MSCCRWTQPFGRPVLPDEYSQNAGASLFVGAAVNTGDARSTSVSKEIALCSGPRQPRRRAGLLDRRAPHRPDAPKAIHLTRPPGRRNPAGRTRNHLLADHRHRRVGALARMESSERSRGRACRRAPPAMASSSGASRRRGRRRRLRAGGSDLPDGFATKVTVVHRRDTCARRRSCRTRRSPIRKSSSIWNTRSTTSSTRGKGEVKGRAPQLDRRGRDLPVDGVFVAIGHTPNTRSSGGRST